MDIATAQKDVRTVFLGGFAGQLVSSAIWLASAVCCTWVSFRVAVWVLMLGGFFIFPLTQLLLRSMKRAGSLPKGHPMNALGIQVAFTLPFTLPLVFAATLYQQRWFYPAFMIVLGAHYLPFIFMYGMPQFGVLAAMLIGSGLLIALYVPSALSLGGWLTAFLLFAFAFIGLHVTRSERRTPQR